MQKKTRFFEYYVCISALNIGDNSISYETLCKCSNVLIIFFELCCFENILLYPFNTNKRIYNECNMHFFHIKTFFWTKTVDSLPYVKSLKILYLYCFDTLFNNYKTNHMDFKV